jgi:hypothetical protein
MQRKERGRQALGFERSGSEKIGFDYHVGEMCTTEYWMHYIEGIGIYLSECPAQP